MSSKICDICNVVTYDQVSFENHQRGSKHQHALQQQHMREKKEKCSIYVKGFPKNTQKEEIIQFFSQYGTVLKCFAKVDENFVLLQFQNEDDAKAVVQNTLQYKGSSLQITHRKIKPYIPIKNIDNRVKVPVDDSPLILQKIRRHRYFTSQLDCLIEEVQIPYPKTMEIYNRLCSDLQNCLSTTFIDCRVWPFGSTLSGLAFKYSDVDVFIEVVVPPVVNMTGDCSLPAIYVKKTKKLLSRSKLFSNVFGIPKAKTPIVKCFHVPTGVNCDINFKNLLGVCNSNLIKFFLEHDMRVKRIMIILKYWGRVQEITGSGKLSNYSLTLLLFFYLQQLPMPILPPIGFLQIPPFFLFQEGWNGGFCSDHNYIKKYGPNNKTATLELLKNFFKFYSTFDFGLFVICPLIAEAIPKADFSHPEKLTDKLFHYKCRVKEGLILKINTPMCIQDPFELVYNTTGHLPAKLIENFQKLCQTSYGICQNNEEINILPKIFTKLPNFNAYLTNDTCTFNIPISRTIQFFDESSPNLRELWFAKVNEFLSEVLTKVLQFKIKVKRNTQLAKMIKLSGQTDVHTTNIIDSITYYCIGNYNVWDTRKSVSKSVKDINEKSAFDREIAISDYIVSLIKDVKITEPLVHFEFTFNSKINPTHAEFVLNNLNSRLNYFKIMASNLKTKLTVWFQKYLEKNEQVPAKNETATSATEVTEILD